MLPSMVEENIDYSSCTVDNESNSPHVITDHLSDGVTLAVADSTTPTWQTENLKKYGYNHDTICLLCVYEGQIKLKKMRDTK